MKISVIIPVFNEEKYLPLCLDSLITQTRPVDEIIICNNNSTDKSGEVALRYQKQLPIKIINQPIKGIIPTVEKAWRSSTGDLIIRTDADAIQPPPWVASIEKHFLNDPSLAACGGDSLASDGHIFLRFYMKYLFRHVTGTVFTLKNGHFTLYGPNVAFRRSALEQVNGYLTNQVAVDDELITQKLFQAKLKFSFFADCWNYHSTRRYHNPLNLIPTLMAAILSPKYYQYKST